MQTGSFVRSRLVLLMVYLEAISRMQLQIAVRVTVHHTWHGNSVSSWQVDGGM